MYCYYKYYVKDACAVLCWVKEIHVMLFPKEKPF